MKTTSLSIAALLLLAVSNGASAAHIRHHGDDRNYRDYQAVSPYAAPLPAWPTEARPFFAPNAYSNQTLTGGPVGGLGS